MMPTSKFARPRLIDKPQLVAAAGNKPSESKIDKSKVRVTGPFTVEAVPAVTIEQISDPDGLRSEPGGLPTGFEADASIARSGATARQEDWRSELLQTGVRGKGGAQIEFARLEILPAMRYLHAVGETKGEDRGDKPHGTQQRVVVSFGPEHAPLEQRHVDQALDEAEHLRPKPDLVLFAAFHFDPEAAKDIDETTWPGVEVHKVQMNADLLTDDLKKKKSSNESFWLIGQPDISVQKLDGEYQVTIHGFDYYNPGTVDSGGPEKIALWLLDTDYDGRSLYPRQVFFVLSPGSDQLKRLAKTLRAEIDEERIESYYGTQSLPFAAGEYKRIAVKIVDDRGIESLKVVNLE